MVEGNPAISVVIKLVDMLIHHRLQSALCPVGSARYWEMEDKMQEQLIAFKRELEEAGDGNL